MFLLFRYISLLLLLLLFPIDSLPLLLPTLPYCLFRTYSLRSSYYLSSHISIISYTYRPRQRSTYCCILIICILAQLQKFAHCLLYPIYFAYLFLANPNLLSWLVPDTSTMPPLLSTATLFPTIFPLPSIEITPPFSFYP